jgi:hypothetical protein
MKNKKQFKVLEKIDEPGIFYVRTDRTLDHANGKWVNVNRYESKWVGPVFEKVRTTKNPLRALKYIGWEANDISRLLDDLPGFKVTTVCCTTEINFKA